MAEDGRGQARALGDWVRAAEAAFWLGVAAVALRTLPFRRLARLVGGAQPVRRPFAARPEAAEAIGRAVAAAACRAPWPILCFEKGLAAHAMLRLRGRPSVLYYGGRMDASRGLTAHVWVEVGGLGVVGAREAAGYAVLATFPPGRSAPRPT